MSSRPWQIVAAVVGAVVGIFAVRYLGLNAVIPALSVAAMTSIAAYNRGTSSRQVGGPARDRREAS